MWFQSCRSTHSRARAFLLAVLIFLSHSALAVGADVAAPLQDTAPAKVLIHRGHQALSTDDYREAIDSFRDTAPAQAS